MFRLHTGELLSLFDILPPTRKKGALDFKNL
jgi:hypothetical protein